ncbi:MAG: hypothetical protein AAF196_16810 [Planctomycetota bacterium]
MLKVLFAVSLASASFAVGHSVTHASTKDTALYAFESATHNSVALWWQTSTDKQGPDGWVSINHGEPVWKDSYDKEIESGRFDGVRWRLGQNYWTVLDTNVNLTFGETEVAANGYYVVLERTEEGDFRAFLLDQAQIRTTGLIASDAAKTTGGIEIPLEHEVVETKAENLTIGFSAREDDNETVDWTIHFGPHKLTANFRRSN